MSDQENKHERQAREMLEASLPPDEKLQAYTSRSFAVDFLSKTYHPGLTIDRHILVPYKRSQQLGPVLSIWQDTFQSLKWSGLGRRLKVKFGRDELQISIRKRL